MPGYQRTLPILLMHLTISFAFDFWLEHPGYESTARNYVDTESSLEKCKSLCLESSHKCIYGLDFSSDSECYIAAGSSLKVNQGGVHFEYSDKELGCDPPFHHSCDLQSTNCSDTSSNYTCICKEGYRQNLESDVSCLDVDECGSTCMSYHLQECTNTPGSHICRCKGDLVLDVADDHCKCPLGFSMHEQTLCSDINECENESACELSVEMCTNVQGSYFCMCKLGLESVNSSCVDVDECQGYNLCSYSTEDCINTHGSHNCVCKINYKMVEGKCKDTEVNKKDSNIVLTGLLILFFLTNFLAIPVYAQLLKTTGKNGRPLLTKSVISSNSSFSSSSKLTITSRVTAESIFSTDKLSSKTFRPSNQPAHQSMKTSNKTKHPPRHSHKHSRRLNEPVDSSYYQENMLRLPSYLQQGPRTNAGSVMQQRESRKKSKKIFKQTNGSRQTKQISLKPPAFKQSKFTKNFLKWFLSKRPATTHGGQDALEDNSEEYGGKYSIESAGDMDIEKVISSELLYHLQSSREILHNDIQTSQTNSFIIPIVTNTVQPKTLDFPGNIHVTPPRKEQIPTTSSSRLNGNSPEDPNSLDRVHLKSFIQSDLVDKSVDTNTDKGFKATTVQPTKPLVGSGKKSD